MTHKFKVGDKVFRNNDAGHSSAWVRFCGYKKSLGDLVVTSVSQGGNYIQLNAWSDSRDQDDYPFLSADFTLCKGQSGLCPTCHQDLRACEYDGKHPDVQRVGLTPACSACNYPNKGYVHSCTNSFGSVDVKVGGAADMVHQPKHYQVFPGIEAIQIIARAMTEEQFKGYCFGCSLKYRLRAGEKFNTEEDLKKAKAYIDLYEKHRHACMDEDI